MAERQEKKRRGEKIREGRRWEGEDEITRRERVQKRRGEEDRRRYNRER